MNVMMNILISFVILIAINTFVCCCDFVQDEMELVLAFMLHRHGDRTPVKATIGLSTDPETVEILTSQYGYGQLTDVGKRRSYELGKSIRRRYGSYLSPQYNRSEIYIRSTDSTRTKMSVLTAMAAVYSVNKEDNWSNEINWTPVPYTTVPALYDTNLASMNCPVFVEKYPSLMTLSDPALVQRYSTALNALSDVTGINITSMPVMAYVIYDVYVSQINLGVPVNEEIEALLPEIAGLAGDSMELLYDSGKNASLLAGVLLNEFFEAADRVKAGDAVQKIQVFSAHDVNVYSFTAVTKVRPKQGVPKYNSLYSLELRKVLATGEYIVVPVYFKEPGADEIYLQVEGCDGFCDLESFRAVTADNVLDTDEWRTLCEFSENYNVDTSSID